MSDNKISISIVLYNEDSRFFNDLYNTIHSAGVVERLFVIDNSPTSCIDTSLYPDVDYIHCPENPGYGAGHNIALRRSIGTTPYHIVMNPDIHFNPAILAQLIDRMDRSPEVGLMMPMIRNPDGSPQYLCRLLPNPLDLFLRRFTPKILYPLVRGYLEKRDLRFSGYTQEMDIPFLSGCFMVLRTALLEKTGIFDENYFMYAEDLDLSRRIYIHSRCLFYPAVGVVHEHGRRSYKKISMMIKHIMSIIRYFNKWGWFFDNERKKINKKTISEIKVNV